MRALGDYLRKRRLDLGLLQSEEADKLGVDEMTVCNWEINRTSPQLRFIPRIIEFLGYMPDDTQVEDLGQQIVAARRRLGLSQRDLAHCLGVDPGTLGRWERGKGRPSQRYRGRPLAFLAGQAPGPTKPQRRSGPREDR